MARSDLVNAAGWDRDHRTALLARVVEALERSAELAEQHARREERRNRPASAAFERRRSLRARALTERVRARGAGR